MEKMSEYNDVPLVQQDVDCLVEIERITNKPLKWLSRFKLESYGFCIINEHKIADFLVPVLEKNVLDIPENLNTDYLSVVQMKCFIYVISMFKFDKEKTFETLSPICYKWFQDLKSNNIDFLSLEDLITIIENDNNLESECKSRLLLSLSLELWKKHNT